MKILVLALLAPLAAYAIPPPPHAPCAPQPPGISVAALGAILAGNGDEDAKRCARDGLATRGAAAARVATGLLGAKDRITRKHAILTLHELGPQAAAALPALVARIKVTPPDRRSDERQSLFLALGQIGAAATPAIPFLIGLADHPRNDEDALMTLGELGAHDKVVVAPYLASRLKRPARHHLTLLALGTMGKSAKAVLPELNAFLKRSVGEKQYENACVALDAIVAIDEPVNTVPLVMVYLRDAELRAAAVSAVAKIGPAAAASAPIMIGRIEASRSVRYETEYIVAALSAVAPASIPAQEQLLIEATQYRSSLAILTLSKVKPLPARFVPALKAAVARDRDIPLLRVALANAQAGK